MFSRYLAGLLLFLATYANADLHCKIENKTESFETEFLKLSVNVTCTVSKAMFLNITDKFMIPVQENVQHLKFDYTRIQFIPDDLFMKFPQLLWLNVRNYEQKEIISERFTGAENLEFLDLSSNDLYEIREKVFIHLRSLKVLNLDKNLFEVLNEDSFHGLNDLLLLDISRNRIRRIECGAFKSLHKLIILNMERNSLDYLMEGFFTGLTNLKVFNVSENLVENVYEELQSLKELEVLDLSKNSLQEVLDSSFKGLEMLLTLKLNQNLLQSLSENAFKDLTNLKELSLQDNFLQELSDNQFKTLGKLEMLQLSDNWLHKIETKLFSNQLLLSNLTINNNRDLIVEDFTFQNLVNLKTLELKSNAIKEISELKFKGLINLKTLNLTDNNVTDIANNSFQDLRNLVELDLSHNELKTLHSETFNGLGSLKILVMHENKISSISLESFKFMRNLTNLTVNHNLIKTLPLFESLDNLGFLNLSTNQIDNVESLTKVKSLLILDLSQNNISTLSQSFLNGSVKLEELILTSNNITRIENQNFFFQFPLLKIIDLGENEVQGFDPRTIGKLFDLQYLNILGDSTISLDTESVNNLGKLEILKYHMKITNIADNFFQNFSLLQDLSLKDNKLTKIRNSTFTGLLNVKTLELQNNVIESIEPFAFMDLTILIKLNLSRNAIGHIDDKLFEKQKKLKFLDLSMNKITVISEEVFKYPVWIKKLYLANNGITKLSDPMFDKLYNLVYLYLNNNNISRIMPETFVKTFDLEVIDLSNNKCTDKKVELHIYSNKNNLAPTCVTCVVPTIINGQPVDESGTKFKEGDFIPNREKLQVVCEAEYFVSKDFKVTCVDGKWDQEFPECGKFCPGDQIVDPTVYSKCILNKTTVACDQNQQPDTIAEILCKPGYQSLAKDNAKQSLRCLEGGNWDRNFIKCTPICGRLVAKSQALIVGGSDVEISDVPWQAAIYKSREKLTKLLCGGSILSSKVIISASHCFYDDNTRIWTSKNVIKVVVGKYFRNFTAEESHQTQIFSVKEIKSEGFNGFSGFYQNDIAILILEGVIIFEPHVVPICIDLDGNGDGGAHPGDIGIVAGWGFTSLLGKPSKTLKKIEMPVVDFDQCKNEAGNFRPFVTPDKYCSGYLNGTGVCRGDSGGGMAFSSQQENGQEVFYIKGIVSNGKYLAGVSACDHFYTLFTDVSQFIPFIKNLLNDNI